jgi:hypothetical protein
VRVLDLIDWKKELRTPNEFTSIGAARGGNAIMKPDESMPTESMPISGLDTDIIADHPAAEPSADPAFDWPSATGHEAELAAAAPQPEASVPPADVHAALLQAIVDPGIYTSKADRHRAIDLRWILRDIAADRLKASPISRLDLQLLVDMQLVELHGGVPRLTDAGVTAIR